MNPLIRFLAKFEPPCGLWDCPTHGFESAFWSAFEDAFPTTEMLFAAMSSFSGTDLNPLSAQRVETIYDLTLRLPFGQREQVIAGWYERMDSEPELATAMIVWFDWGRRLPGLRSMEDMIRAARRGIARDQALRDEVRTLVADYASLPTEIAEAIERDVQKEEEAENLERQRVEKLRNHLDALARIPFRERIPRVMSDETLRNMDWRDLLGSKRNWASCSDADLEGLGAAEVQQLIDICEANSSWHTNWRGALSKLYDKRHELRIARMEETRQRIGHLPLREQLMSLLADPSIPIEAFPIELADFCTFDLVERLSRSEKRELIRRLDGIRLRRWKRVLAHYRDGLEARVPVRAS